ncbi:MAG: deoxyribodipyrimidine photo-lyase [Phycisphaerales bacterium]|nr:deoxyribodipyrimidine photo-lyase [Phycisphaerales bacterium]
MELTNTTVVWYRNDLRTDDHAPLVYAAQRGNVIPLYILDFDETEKNSLGGASKWWRNHSLISLSESLKKMGSQLVIRQGKVEQVLIELCSEAGADQIVIHDSIEPDALECDDKLDDLFDRSGVELVRFPSNLLWPVGSILNNSANPYQVFTPFWNRGIQQSKIGQPISAPLKLHSPDQRFTQLSVEQLILGSNPEWASGMNRRWSPGENGAFNSFRQFQDLYLEGYHEDRDQLADQGWSALSAPLHFGELSVRRVWHTLTQQANWEQDPGRYSFLRQLGWRDFAAHLLNHFPHTTDNPLREQFQQFPWRDNENDLSKWKKGMTGYPVVDAAMRHLWQEGWMPNRARMIVASFLCKDLLISWQDGAAWFWDTLVDADIANNTLGWQWVAGSGADASPFFRIFNPMTQGKKFDPKGEYVRRWVPELASLSDKNIHTPWLAPVDALNNAGVVLGKNYPYPIVDHAQARVSALDAYSSIK